MSCFKCSRKTQEGYRDWCPTCLEINSEIGRCNNGHTWKSGLCGMCANNICKECGEKSIDQDSRLDGSRVFFYKCKNNHSWRYTYGPNSFDNDIEDKKTYTHYEEELNVKASNEW